MAQFRLQPKSANSRFKNSVKHIWQGLIHLLVQRKVQPERGITFFPLRFEEYIYTHWYFFTIGLYLAFMLLGISIDVIYGYLFHEQAFYYLQYDFRNTVFFSDLTDWIYILGVVALSVIAIVFNAWRSGIYRKFELLMSNQRLRPLHREDDVNQEYRQFLEQYQQALLSNKRYWLVSAITLIYVGYILFALPQAFSYYSGVAKQVLPLLGIVGFVRFFVGTPLALFLEGYFFVSGIWVVATTGRYVKKLAQEFDFNIQPDHPDHSGGLRSLGDLCLGIALPLLILAVLLATYSLCGLFLPNSNLIEPVLADLLLFPVVLPIAAFAFFGPLWNIHQKMLNEKNAEEDKAANRIAALKEKIETLLDQENLEEAKATKEKLEIIQALHADNDRYPTWPFDRTILVKFLAPQVLSLLSLLVQLGPVVDALKYLFRVS